MQRHNSWITLACNELAAARRLLYDNEPLIAQGLYWCQQSVEKALKGYLSFKNHSLIKTHDLVTLIKLCSSFDKDFEQFSANGA